MCQLPSVSIVPPNILCLHLVLRDSEYGVDANQILVETGRRRRHTERVCFTQENYRETWKDVEVLSQVFFPWKEVYKTHPDDEQQLTVHYFLERLPNWLPCRSESIKTELLTIAFLSC